MRRYLQLLVISVLLHLSFAENKLWSEDFLNNLDAHNKVAHDYLLTLNMPNSQWKFVNEKDGVTVYKRKLNESPIYLSDEDISAGKKHAIVKSTGIIDAPPKAVFDLFTNNKRVKEYNEHCAVLRDVQYFPRKSKDCWSKVAWAASPKYGLLKAREFCSIVYFNQQGNGAAVILNRPAYLDICPASNQYVRATILLAGNIIEPYGPNGNQTKLTQIAHVNPGGISDTPAIAWVVNKLCAVGPPTFIRKLEIAAKRSPNIEAENGMDLFDMMKTWRDNFIQPRLVQVTQLSRQIKQKYSLKSPVDSMLKMPLGRVTKM